MRFPGGGPETSEFWSFSVSLDFLDLWFQGEAMGRPSRKPMRLPGGGPGVRSSADPCGEANERAMTKKQKHTKRGEALVVSPQRLQGEALGISPMGFLGGGPLVSPDFCLSQDVRKLVLGRCP
jgi:hypothetical protein